MKSFSLFFAAGMALGVHAVAIPSGCEDNIANSRTINQFSFTNTTHNCDCAASRPDVGDGTGCLDANGNWCDPKKDANCTHCGIGVCMTGLPSQPVGYGPPDVVNFGFTDGFQCQQANPQGFKPFEVGEGHMYCGGRYPAMSFTANSNAAKSNGVVTYDDVANCGDDSYSISYKATFAITCAHDASFNATCKATSSKIKMPLVAVSKLNN